MLTETEIKDYFTHQGGKLRETDGKTLKGYAMTQSKLMEEGFTKNELKKYVKLGWLHEDRVVASKKNTNPVSPEPQMKAYYVKPDPEKENQK